MDDFVQLITSRAVEIVTRTGEHFVLTGLSVMTATLIGIPLGVFAYRVPRLRHGLIGLVNIFQTIPSLAMLAILLVVMGKIGVAPALVALVLYALLPIVRNTMTGLSEISPAINEAGIGIGMTRRQLLFRVQLPLALPVVMSGIRTATVIGVGIATLSAFIGAGGLGEFINRGLATYNTNLVLLGALPAAILALLIDGCLSLAERALRPATSSERHSLRHRFKPLFVALPVIVFAAGMGLSLVPRLTAGDDRSTSTVTVGSKNFTEQFILAELMAQLIEDRTSLQVQRQFNLGGTMICHNALLRAGMDVYAEYTGTALTAILDESVTSDANDAYDRVAQAYREQYDLEWLKPFGFDNTYTITVRDESAQENGWRTISDLAGEAGELSAGFTSEFMERQDGYPGLKQAYGLEFGSVTDLESSLMYEALDQDQVDVICGFATDGRIVRYGLKPLKDDRNFFPPYEAAPVVRREILEAHPQIRMALNLLAGELDNATMQRLNSRVDQDRVDVRTVARDFLAAVLPDPGESPERKRQEPQRP
jgi:osmoprotectant transport system permease protein